jgi:hypothetical protein
MKRRDLLAGMGFAGYSLVVRADEPPPPSPVRVDERLRRELDRIAPPMARCDRSEFGESLAPEKADGETLGSSLLFTSRQHPDPDLRGALLRPGALIRTDQDSGTRCC